jgi:hypothetical protein
MHIRILFSPLTPGAIGSIRAIRVKFPLLLTVPPVLWIQFIISTLYIAADRPNGTNDRLVILPILRFPRFDMHAEAQKIPHFVIIRKHPAQ